MSDCLTKCGRVLIVILNIIFLLIGLVIFALGMVLKFGFENIKPYLDDGLEAVKDGLKQLTSLSSSLGNAGIPSNANLDKVDELADIVEAVFSGAAIALIIVGSVILVLVILGLCGACYKIKIFLVAYSIILFILMASMVTVTGLYLNNREIIDDKVKPILKKSITDSYEGLKGLDIVSLAWNFGMHEFSCCGVDNYEDFSKATNWNKQPIPGITTNFKAPLACCKTIPTGQTLNAVKCAMDPLDAALSNYNTGCYDILWTYVEKYNKYVMIFVILTTLIEAMIIFLALWIACYNKNKVGHSDD